MRDSNVRKGRPVKEADPGTRVSLGLRVPAATKTLIDERAKVTGRTQSQEAELLIELGLRSEHARVAKLRGALPLLVLEALDPRNGLSEQTRGEYLDLVGRLSDLANRC